MEKKPSIELKVWVQTASIRIGLCLFQIVTAYSLPVIKYLEYCPWLGAHNYKRQKHKHLGKMLGVSLICRKHPQPCFPGLTNLLALDESVPEAEAQSGIWSSRVSMANLTHNQKYFSAGTSHRPNKNTHSNGYTFPFLFYFPPLSHFISWFSLSGLLLCSAP